MSALLSYAEAAKRLNCSVRSVRRLIDTGEIIRVYPRPRLPRILAQSLDDYVARMTLHAHNHSCAGQAVYQEINTCQESAHEIKTVFSNGRTRHSDGRVSQTDAAARLAEVLAFGATKTRGKSVPERSERNGCSNRQRNANKV